MLNNSSRNKSNLLSLTLVSLILLAISTLNASSQIKYEKEYKVIIEKLPIFATFDRLCT